MSLRFGFQMDEQEASQLNALQLAYLGDSVWELIVRMQFMKQKLNVHHLHQHCVKLVNAKAQASILRMIQDTMSETEQNIVKRGRNSHPKHTLSHNQNPDDYAASTGFEALLGYLYLTGNNKRLEDLMNMIGEEYYNG